MKQDPHQTLYLIDISSFIFRAFFAIRRLSNRKGEPTNAVYGVATMIHKLIEQAKPEYVAVAYDSKEPSFRKEIYPDYKANRSAPPDDLIPQFARIEELISAFGLHAYRQSGVEADDLIGALAKRWCDLSPQHHVVIVSGDKDLMQLVGPRVRMWDTLKDVVYDPVGVETKMGVRPDQIRDYLGLVGDSSDNIPGVPGVGPKTAVELLKQFDTLPNLLKAATEGKVSGKKGELLKQHGESAELSARLATVACDLNLSLDPEQARYKFHVTPEVLELLKELDFHTLVEKWSAQGSDLAGAPVIEASQPGKSSKADSTFVMINTEEEFSKLLHRLEKTHEFGFDLETTSLNPRAAEIVGFSLALDTRHGYYIPVGHRGTSVPQLPAGRVLERLKPLLEDPRHKKIGQNLKYDWSVLMNQGVKPDGLGADTMVAAYLLEPEGRHDLQTLARNFLDYEVLTYEQVCGKGKDQIGFDQVPVDLATRYSGEDSWITLKLWEVLKKRLHQDHVMDVFSQVDLPLVPVLARMECEGVCLDEGYLRGLSNDFAHELKGIETQIFSMTRAPINLNSPKQLAVLLFDELGLPPQGKTKTGYSTDASVLEALAPLHEVPRLLLDYREISKLKGTYVDPLPGLKDPKDGKIHASFHQTVTATGRLSSSEPNLQNIPIRTARGKKIRGAFVPSPGNVLISADYSQIELRLLAHMSGDKELVDSFRRDEDVHRRTAAEIFGLKPEQVDDRQRGIAKAINFGLMYGKTAFGLSQELKIPRKEAADVIERYFTRYSGVKKFLDHQIQGAREHGFVETILGRKRRLPDIESKNPALRANAERMAMNTPIQGTAADLMKLAMIELDEKLRAGAYGSKLIIQVHDEVVLDCPKKEVPEVEKLVTEVMEKAMRLSVPLRVNSGHGKNWMEL